VPLEFEEEVLTLLLVVTELLNVLLPAVTDWRLHRVVVRFQPSPDSFSVTHAGSASLDVGS
jgi:hypothetical protein